MKLCISILFIFFSVCSYTQNIQNSNDDNFTGSAAISNLNIPGIESLTPGSGCKILLNSGVVIKGELLQIINEEGLMIKNEEGFTSKILFSDISQVLPIKVSSSGSIGIGFGVPYGIVGINFDIALMDYLSFSAGVGHTILADVGYNGGFKLFFAGPESVWRPRVGIFYGVNGIMDLLFEDESTSYRGFSAILGQQLMFGETKSHGLDIDIVFLVTSGVFNKTNELKDMGYIVSDPGFIKFSIGYRYGF